jgi:hypothetical protein
VTGRPQGLADLLDQLERLAAGAITGAELEAWITPVFHDDPLGAERTDAAPWDAAPDDWRLFWRLVYLFAEAPADDDAGALARHRDFARRVAACARSTGSAALTHEMLPLVADQERFCRIVERHLRGVISRTGFLSVIAESGYAPHAKLWLQHAGPAALARLCELLDTGGYREAAEMMEKAP